MMTTNHEERTQEFYQALLRWVLAGHEQTEQKPSFIGMNSPQGAGKTTITTWLCEQLAKRDLVAVEISIDDFYMTREAQEALARAHPGNPHLQMRGYPGTHDIELGTATLRALEDQAEGCPVMVPRYDKSAHGGNGDRSTESKWKIVESPADVVLVEGWMLGFQPNPRAEESDPYLRPVNEALPNYARWCAFLDAFIYIRAQDHRFVLDWRVMAEEKMKAEGLPGMSREAITAYAAAFMTAYETFSHTVSKETLGVSHYLELVIGRDRLPLTRQAFAG
jgi:D-glycerate 3-kinase